MGRNKWVSGQFWTGSGPIQALLARDSRSEYRSFLRWKATILPDSCVESPSSQNGLWNPDERSNFHRRAVFLPVLGCHLRSDDRSERTLPVASYRVRCVLPKKRHPLALSGWGFRWSSSSRTIYFRSPRVQSRCGMPSIRRWRCGHRMPRACWQAPFCSCAPSRDNRPCASWTATSSAKRWDRSCFVWAAS